MVTSALTVEQIVQRLSGTEIVAEPGRRALHGLPADLIEAWFPQPLREAGVLIPLMQRDDGLHVLFTRRTESLPDHAGQISFPGGRKEPEDMTLEHTAIRETDEEIGLGPELIDVIGYLQPHPVITGYVVVPTVGLVTPPASFTAEEREVAEIFEVPLSHLLDPACHHEHIRYRSGVALKTDEFHYVSPEGGEYRIWGATAHMLKSFLILIS